MVWSVGSLKWNQQTSKLNWTYPMFLIVLLLYVGHQSLRVCVQTWKSVCLREKVSSGAYLAQISMDFPSHLWIQHFLLSHLPCFLCEPPIFPASNATHLRRQCQRGLSDQTVHVQGGNCVRYLCSFKVHICLCVRVSTSLPLSFSKEAPRAWFNVVNKASTVSQSCWGVHREPVNGCIFPLLHGHNKSLNLQDQKTDSAAASLV